MNEGEDRRETQETIGGNGNGEGSSDRVNPGPEGEDQGRDGQEHVGDPGVESRKERCGVAWTELLEVRGSRFPPRWRRGLPPRWRRGLPPRWRRGLPPRWRRGRA